MGANPQIRTFRYNKTNHMNDLRSGSHFDDMAAAVVFDDAGTDAHDGDAAESVEDVVGKRADTGETFLAAKPVPFIAGHFESDVEFGMQATASDIPG